MPYNQRIPLYSEVFQLRLSWDDSYANVDFSALLLVKKKSSPWKKWLNVVCAIIGVLLLIYTGVDLFSWIFVVD